MLKRLRILDEAGHVVSHIPLGRDATFEIAGKTQEPLRGVTVAVRINKPTGQRIATVHSGYQLAGPVALEGAFTVSCKLRQCRLMPGAYQLCLLLKSDGGLVDQVDDVACEVTPRDVYGTGKALPERTGVYVPDVEWKVQSGME